MSVLNRAFALLLGGTLAAPGCGGRGLTGDAGQRDAVAGDRDAPFGTDLGQDVPVAIDLRQDTPAATDLSEDAPLTPDLRDDALRPVDGRCPAWSSRPTDAGTCACQDFLPNVCPAPCVDTEAGTPCLYSGFPLLCVDQRNDPFNCGGCAVECAANAVCRDGACGPRPTRVVGPIEGCTELNVAVSGGVLYWADAAHGTITAALTVGGPKDVIARDQLEPTWLRIHGDSLYWIARKAKTLMRVPLAGGAPVLVVKSPNADGPPDTYPGINGYAVLSDGTAYIASAAQIYEITAMADPRLVVEQTDGDFPLGLGVGNGKVAYPQSSGHISATALPPPGAPAVKCGIRLDVPGDPQDPCTIIRSHGVIAEGFYVRGDRAYFVNNVAGGVFTLEIPGGHLTSVQIGYLEGGEVISALTLEGDQAFFMGGAFVAQSPLAPGGQSLSLARGQPFVPGDSSGSFGRSSIAADATHVYWSTAETIVGVRRCSVFRVERR